MASSGGITFQYPKPRHTGPNVLPNHNIFSRLLGYGAQGGIAIRDATNGYEATHLQLLTDVLRVRNVLYDSLEEGTRRRLSGGKEEVFFNLLGPASYEFAVGFFAILAIGGVVVPLSPAYPVKDAQYYVNMSKSEALLTADQCTSLGDQLTEAIRSTTNPKYHNIALRPSIMSPPLPVAQIHVSQDWFLDYHGSGLVIFTSGTTGPPKGAVKPRTYLDASAQRASDIWGLVREDTVMHGLPVHHATGIGTSLMPFLLAGACVEFHSGGFDPAQVWERFRQGGITHYSGVPTIYMRLMRYYETDLSQMPEARRQEYERGVRKVKILMCGTSALPGSLQKKWKDLAGKRILERYGATEFSSCFSIGPKDVMSVPDGSVGKVLAGNDVKLSEGTEGEVLMRSPFMFSKYLFDPEATAEAFDKDGYYKTGDIARKEGDYYFIMGRASIDILKSGGYKISALDVERSILDLPYIGEVMVVGVEDEEFGQRVAAAVVVKAELWAEHLEAHGKPGEETLTLERLRTDMRSRLPGYKIPTMLRVVNELPKSGTGKVMKKTLGPQLFPKEGHPDVMSWQGGNGLKERARL